MSPGGSLGRQRDPLPTRVSGLPDLPSDFRRVLHGGLADLGLQLRPDQRAAIEAHVRLLLAWNVAINLTAIRDPAEVARLHVLDSLTAAPALRSRDIVRFLDLGSGGGFPGVPLAVALEAEAHLVDSVGKKVRFLDTVIEALGLERVTAQAARAETLATDPAHRESWPAVTARAVARLAELVELSYPLLAPGGMLLAWKRALADEEVRAAEQAVGAMGGGRVEVYGAGLAQLPGHQLVVVTKHGRTGPEWPRDPSLRRRRPW